MLGQSDPSDLVITLRNHKRNVAHGAKVITGLSHLVYWPREGLKFQIILHQRIFHHFRQHCCQISTFPVRKTYFLA